MGLAVNEGKTRNMLSTSSDVRRIESQITTDNYNFDKVKEFIYLGYTVTTEDDVTLEIKRRITLANRCYYDLNRQLSSKDYSRTTKLIRYKTLILSVLLYGAEAWTHLSTDAAALRVVALQSVSYFMFEQSIVFHNLYNVFYFKTSLMCVLTKSKSNQASDL